MISVRVDGFPAFYVQIEVAEIGEGTGPEPAMRTVTVRDVQLWSVTRGKIRS